MSLPREGKIAIVGMSYRLPNPSESAFWDRLVGGEDFVTEVEPNRWSKDYFLHTKKSAPGKSYTFSAGSISNASAFDASFFGISPREAIQMDPQQRLLLELAWEALEDAGAKASDFKGSRCGVFIGISSFDYAHRLADDLASVDSKSPTGNAGSIAANRISYFLDTRGPSMIIDTACSSALVAFHEACQSIRNGDSDSALAGGVSLHFHPLGFLSFTKTGMLSRGGRCRTFDAKADGYVRSEGGGILLLKPLDKAISDGDRVLAVVEGSGVNCDGRTPGITVPSGEAQAALLREVYARAGIKAADLDFLEAHGTGTAVGDPIETWAIGEVLGKARPGNNPLAIGSIKSNLGHLEAASAAAGWTKVILMLRHRMVPPNLHFDEPNPRIDFKGLNLRVVDKAEPLSKRKRLLIGINSFGFGGTNAHAILSLPSPPPEKSPQESLDSNPLPFVFSAKSPAALRECAGRLADFFESSPETPLYDAALALRERREWLSKRGVVYSSSRKNLVATLRKFASGESVPDVIEAEGLASAQGPVFVFSGNGGQWDGMGRELFQSNTEFRNAVCEVDLLFESLSGISLLPHFEKRGAAMDISRAELAQPLIFALQVGIVKALAARGMKPAAVIGHSLGEVAAAWAGGALPLASAVRVIRLRSLHQEATRGMGGMTAVSATFGEVETLLSEPGVDGIGIVVSGENAPKSVTVAGSLEDLEAFERAMGGRSIKFKRLDLDYPFHSPSMDSVLALFQAELGHLECSEPELPFFSTVTGSPLTQAPDAAYWVQNLRERVCFRAAIGKAIEEGFGTFLEISPHAILGNHISAILKDKKSPGHVLGTQFREQGGDAALRNAFWRLAVGGAPYDWQQHFPKRPQSFADLPKYPWQRETFLLPVSPEGAGELFRPREHPLLGYRTKQDAWEWESQIDTDLLPWLADHKVGGVVVYPAAAFLESALAAADLRHDGRAPAIEDFEIRSPLALPDRCTKVVRFHLEEDGGQFVIQSRDRMTRDAWQLHVVGRISLHAPANLPSGDHPSGLGAVTLSGEQLYADALALGLDYGPAFQTLKAVSRNGSQITAEINAPAAIQASLLSHRIHPVFIDAAMQSLIALMNGESENAQGQAYLPVRFESFRVLRPHAEVVRTRAVLRRESPRSLLADFRLFDESGETVAVISGARFRAATLAKRSFDRPREFYQKWIEKNLAGPTSRLAGRHEGIRNVLGLAMGESVSGDSALKHYAIEGDALLDTLCAAFAREAFLSLAEGQNEISLATCKASGRISDDMEDFFRGLAAILEQDGWIQKTADDSWTFQDSEDIPSSEEVWRSLVCDFPEHASRLGALGRVGLSLCDLLSGAVSQDKVLPAWSKLSDGCFHIPESALEADLQGIILQTLRGLKPERILWILGPRPSSERFLAPWMRSSGSAVTVLLQDTLEARDVESRLALFSGVEVLQVASRCEALRSLESEGKLFDIVVAPCRFLENSARTVAGVLAAGGAVLSVEKESSRFDEIVQSPLLKQSLSRSARHATLKEYFENVESLPLLPGKGLGPSILLAGSSAVPLQSPPPSSALIIPLDEFSFPLAEELQKNLSCDIELLPPSEAEAVQIWGSILGAKRPDRLVFLSSGSSALQGAQSLATELGAVSACLRALSAAGLRTTVTIATSRSDSLSHGLNWVSAGLWGFARVARNEFPQIRIRCVDLPPSGNLAEALDCLFPEVSRPDQEDEVRWETGRRLVARVACEGDCSGRGGDALLDFEAPGSFQNLRWVGLAPRQPESGEVAIAVHAAGLNFRDVMYAMGLLPDEALENGFAGSTLGMELSGIVSSTGLGVEEFKPGDEVIAFSPASFSTRAVTKASAVMLKPQGISFEAAATIPAAFFTAWHALVELANLQHGERILIHGAAGGVGIAAIQIARWLGAEIFATAGSEDKRAFIRLLGAEHVYDSRSMDFASGIRSQTMGEGIDVVLNSIAGEAVTRNLEILRPFGRFLELGKRDFYENNRIGLRPLRNNIRYFAVDADQLMALRPHEASAAFGKLMALFREGVLSPLPFTVFQASEVSQAFRHMQHSAHTGKVVVQMSDVARGKPRPHGSKFSTPSDATWLVTGGLQGFGLQTAKWLVDSGASHLVLISRRGPTTPEAAAFIEDCKRLGVQVWAEACDVANRSALDALLTRMRRDLPPLTGVIHAAMVLNDALIANLDPAKIRDVLEPKVTGAAVLHELTHDDNLKHFVLYSSATTLFGNPGQSIYVAANAALEELATLRQREGLPACCISWGPIGDVGYLSRNAQVKEALGARTGGHPLESSDALRFLGQTMASGESVVAWMDLDWRALSRFLPSAASPRYQMLRRPKDHVGNDAEQSENLRVELQLMNPPELFETLKGLLKEEISTILRVPVVKLDENRSLMEIGMDSLMGMELISSLENTLGVSVPVMALGESPTISKLAERLCQIFKPTIEPMESNAEQEPPLGDDLRSLAAQHGATSSEVERLSSTPSDAEDATSRPSGKALDG